MTGEWWEVTADGSSETRPWPRPTLWQLVRAAGPLNAFRILVLKWRIKRLLRLS